MIMIFDISAGAKNGQGDVPFDGTLTETKIEAKTPLEEKLAAAIRPQADAFKGLRLKYFVTPKGYLHDVKVEVPEGFPEDAQQLLSSMSQSFESLLAPLPDAPVGVGARWEVISRVASSGADLVQQSFFTLKERKDSMVTLDITMQQFAATDRITVPSMTSGAAAHLRSFKSNGSGTNWLNIKDPAPESGKMNTTSNMELALDLLGGRPGAPPDKTNVDVELGVIYSRPAK